MSGHVREHKRIRFCLLLPPSVHLSLFACLSAQLSVCLPYSRSVCLSGTVARQVSREEYGQGRGDGWMDGTREGGKWKGWIDETVC